MHKQFGFGLPKYIPRILSPPGSELHFDARLYKMSFEMALWRDLQSIICKEMHLKALTPLARLNIIAGKTQSIKTKPGRKKVLRRMKCIRLDDSSTSSKSSNQAAASQQADAVHEQEAKMHKLCLDEVVRLRADKLAKSLNSYADRVRGRCKEVDALNPLYQTFDILHLQEMHLLTKKINRSDRVKNDKRGEMRRGGKCMKRQRKRLD